MKKERGYRLKHLHIVDISKYFYFLWSESYFMLLLKTFIPVYSRIFDNEDKIFIFPGIFKNPAPASCKNNINLKKQEQ